MDIIEKLNAKIVVDDLIIKKMRYDINSLFANYTSKEKAVALSRQIKSQINSALNGINEKEKDEIQKLLILNSFLTVENPVSDKISYGNVFTTLTNYEDDFLETRNRLENWLEDNTDIKFSNFDINQYLKVYKISNTNNSTNIEMEKYISIDETILDENTYDYDKSTEKDETNIYRVNKTHLLKYVILIVFILSVTYFFDKVSFFNQPEVFEENNNEIITRNVEDSLKEHLTEEANIIISNYYTSEKTGIPLDFIYSEMNRKMIYKYLITKNSMLTSHTYLDTIIQKSKNSNVNPLLLIAIIGQEQGFVNKDSENAIEIIRNPYNVYGSWIDYNTSFEDATQICLNTIVNSAKERPPEYELIKWLNTTYAEDEKWSIGVEKIFTKLQVVNSQ